MIETALAGATLVAVSFVAGWVMSKDRIKKRVERGMHAAFVQFCKDLVSLGVDPLKVHDAGAVMMKRVAKIKAEREAEEG